MSRFHESVEIHAPAERVWSVMAQIERWPEWAPTFRRIERIGAADGEGARFRVDQPRLPRADMTVTRWQPGLGFTWASRTPLLRATGDHVIEALRPGACRVDLELRFEGLLAPVAGRMLRKLVTEYVASEARSLKKQVERKAGQRR